MCMMCDEEGMYLEYLAYLHDLAKRKKAAGEDTSEIDQILADNGYVNLDTANSESASAVAVQPDLMTPGLLQTASKPAPPTSPFSCDPVDE